MIVQQVIDDISVIEREASALGIKPYLVGGLVRDLLNNQLDDTPDIDLVIESELSPFKENLALALNGKLQRETSFITTKIVLNKSNNAGLQEIDIARARTETYKRGGALPEVAPASIKDDLRRRDFTINAMALPLSTFKSWLLGDRENYKSEVIDFFSGKEDLSNRLIRVLHPNSFIDDPTSIFRAFRYLVRNDGSLEKETESLISLGVKKEIFRTISKFRLIKEIKKICLEKGALRIIKLLNSYQVLPLLKLFNKDKTQYVFSALEKVNFNGSENAFKSFMSCCYAFATPEQRVSYVKDFSLGKSFVIECAKSHEMVMSQNLMNDVENENV